MLVERFYQKGLRISAGSKREMGNLIQALKIDKKEGEKFLLKLHLRMLAKTFSIPRKMYTHVNISFKRECELALLLLKQLMNKESLNLSKDALRDLEKIAKNISVPENEIRVFIKVLLHQQVDELFQES